jgi:hypothetical protein
MGQGFESDLAEEGVDSGNFRQWSSFEHFQYGVCTAATRQDTPSIGLNPTFPKADPR